ncbi:MAG: hypothetical protein WBM03_16280 [Steroidobacteraceae bacterium]
MKFRLVAATMALVLAHSVMGTAVADAGIRQEQVQFAKGASSAVIKGQLKGDAIVDYLVRVYLMRPAARRGESSDYTLTVGASGKALAPIAASKDALVAGG